MGTEESGLNRMAGVWTARQTGRGWVRHCKCTMSLARGPTRWGQYYMVLELEILDSSPVDPWSQLGSFSAREEGFKIFCVLPFCSLHLLRFYLNKIKYVS